MISPEAHANRMAAKDFDYAVMYYQRINDNSRLLYEAAFAKLLELLPGKDPQELQGELVQIAYKNNGFIC